MLEGTGETIYSKFSTQTNDGMANMNGRAREEIHAAGLDVQFAKPLSSGQLPTLAEWNQKYVEYVLRFAKGKKTAAARILGINRRTLYRRKKPSSSPVEHGHELAVISAGSELAQPALTH